MRRLIRAVPDPPTQWSRLFCYFVCVVWWRVSYRPLKLQRFVRRLDYWRFAATVTSFSIKILRKRTKITSKNPTPNSNFTIKEVEHLQTRSIMTIALFQPNNFVRKQHIQLRVTVEFCSFHSFIRLFVPLRRWYHQKSYFGSVNTGEH